jgi:putative cell wall-binding protein
MRKIKVLLIMSVILIVSFTVVYAASDGTPVTPYGDFCPKCGKYGTCRSQMSLNNAKQAIAEYYHEKGLNIDIENEKGRFIKASVKDNGKVVDVIIFDRRTGRIRSIY